MRVSCQPHCTRYCNCAAIPARCRKFTLFHTLWFTQSVIMSRGLHGVVNVLVANIISINQLPRIWCNTERNPSLITELRLYIQGNCILVILTYNRIYEITYIDNNLVPCTSWYFKCCTKWDFCIAVRVMQAVQRQRCIQYNIVSD